MHNDGIDVFLQLFKKFIFSLKIYVLANGFTEIVILRQKQTKTPYFLAVTPISQFGYAKQSRI
jgi:hypothetical protein